VWASRARRPGAHGPSRGPGLAAPGDGPIGKYAGMEPEVTHDLLTDAPPVEPRAPEETLRPMTPGERTAFQVLSASTAPVWVAMLVAPNSRFTERFVRLATPLYAALGVAYVATLATAVAGGDGEPLRFDDPDSWRRGLANPTGFLAGWTHYLVFDLFVGRHIWAEARARGRTDRLPLLLTWMAGPAGLTLHLARNGRDNRRARRGAIVAVELDGD